MERQSKLLPHSYPGVYELSCDCGGEYTGETKKRVLTGSIEFEEDNLPGKWETSGATEHSKIAMGGLIGYIQKHLQNCPTYTNVKEGNR